MSNNKWLALNAKPSNYANDIFRTVNIIDAGDIVTLAKVLAFPDVLTGFFSKPSDWVSNLTLYPYTIITRQEIAKGKLTIGGVKTDIPAINIDLSSEIYNMGEYFVTPKFNNFADYNGYSKMEVWLPYCGLVDVDLNQTLNRYLKFRLNIDYTTGNGVWFICVGDTPTEYNVFAPQTGEDIQILSTHICQIGAQVPLGSSNAVDIMRNLAMGALKAGVGAIGGYTISKLGATGGTATTTKNITTTRRNPTTGRQITARKRTETSQTTYDGSNYQFGRAITETFDYATDSLANMHISASTDRVNNPMSLMNGSQSVKVIRYYPKIVETNEAYGRLYGYPLGKAVELSTLTGYTVVTEFHVEGDGFGQATRKEIMMIKEALSEGIIL